MQQQQQQQAQSATANQQGSLSSCPQTADINGTAQHLYPVLHPKTRTTSCLTLEQLCSDSQRTVGLENDVDCGGECIKLGKYCGLGQNCKAAFGPEGCSAQYCDVATGKCSCPPGQAALDGVCQGQSINIPPANITIAKGPGAWLDQSSTSPDISLANTVATNGVLNVTSPSYVYTITLDEPQSDTGLMFIWKLVDAATQQVVKARSGKRVYFRDVPPGHYVLEVYVTNGYPRTAAQFYNIWVDDQTTANSSNPLPVAGSDIGFNGTGSNTTSNFEEAGSNNTANTTQVLPAPQARFDTANTTSNLLGAQQAPFNAMSPTPSPCKDMVCVNNGTCITTNSTSARCSCRPGYAGSLCQSNCWAQGMVVEPTTQQSCSPCPSGAWFNSITNACGKLCSRLTTPTVRW